MANCLYIKANGEIPCYDDFGESKNLADLLPEKNRSIADILTSAPFRHIRDSLRGDTVPWPGTCDRCGLFRPNEPFDDSFEKERRINILQLEPTLRCHLRCPGCSAYDQRKVRRPPHSLSFELFKHVVDDLVANDIQVGEIEFCGQGEPALNGRTWDMIGYFKTQYPQTKARIITNGHFASIDNPMRCHLDEIYVSCDGFYQESYAKYRVGGNVAVPLGLMAAMISHRKTHRLKLPTVIWKYILFEFNDSDQEILDAQTYARKEGIDVLLFVLTHSEYHSRRFGYQESPPFPIYYSNVSINATPVQSIAYPKQIQTARLAPVREWVRRYFSS